MPVVQPPRKPQWYYPHEEFFAWVLVLVAGLLAMGLQGVWFVASLIVFMPFWPLVFLAWWIWREWDSHE